MKSILKKITDIINGLAILGLLICYLAPYVDPLDFWPISFFGLTYVFWLCLNVALLFFWVFAGSKRWIYNLLFILIGFSFVGRHLQSNATSSEKSDIKICSFNTNVQQVYGGGNTSKEIEDYLIDNRYDVAVLIEYLDKKGSINKNAYPHQQLVRLNSKRNKFDYGIKLLSKHRIVNWEKIKYDHFTNNMSAYFDIDINGEIVRFVATHLQSNGISSRDYHKLVKVEIDDVGYKNYAVNFIRKLKILIQRRSNQTNTVLEAIEDSPYPVVILGDFNDTPMSYTYQQLKEGRQDAFIEKGSGWGATYLKPFRMLRIDYILHDPELECLSYKYTTATKSDHALIEASFKIKK